jgi:hypothetical protein
MVQLCHASNAVIRGSAIITVKPVPTATNVLPLVSQFTMATVGNQCYPLVLMPPFTSMYTTLKIINRKFLGVSLIWTFFSHVGAIFFLKQPITGNFCGILRSTPGKTCKTHTYSISVKQSLVSIILYNGFSNNATDINDFLCKILGYW